MRALPFALVFSLPFALVFSLTVSASNGHPPPVISLSLEEDFPGNMQHTFIHNQHREMCHTREEYSELGMPPPEFAPVSCAAHNALPNFKQALRFSCEVGQPASSCRQPAPVAYDHHDKELTAQKSIVLVLESDPGKKTQRVMRPVLAVDYSMRGEYSVHFDAKDEAGNEAEQVTYVLTLRDENPPNIVIPKGVPHTLQACDVSNGFLMLPGMTMATPSAEAFDQYDGQVPVHATLLAPGSEIAVPSLLINTRVLGEWKVTYTAHDYASLFGLHGKSNIKTVTYLIQVQDTLPPQLYCKPSGVSVFPDSALAGFAAPSFATNLYGDAGSVVDCAGQCEKQEWSRLVGSTINPTSCEFFEYHHATRNCKLFPGNAVSVADLAAGTIAGVGFDEHEEPPSSGVTRGYNRQCQAWLSYSHECDASSQYADFGARCIDARDSWHVGTAALTDTFPVAQTTESALHSGSGSKRFEYNCEDEVGNKAATVTRAANVKDTLKPVLLLNGVHDSQEYVMNITRTINENKLPSSYTCTDKCDGSLHAEIQVFNGHCEGAELVCGGGSGSADTGVYCPTEALPGGSQRYRQPLVDGHESLALPGTFVMKYTCRDSAMNNASKCRTINAVWAPTTIATISLKFVVEGLTVPQYYALESVFHAAVRNSLMEVCPECVLGTLVTEKAFASQSRTDDYNEAPDVDTESALRNQNLQQRRRLLLSAKPSGNCSNTASADAEDLLGGAGRRSKRDGPRMWLHFVLKIAVLSGPEDAFLIQKFSQSQEYASMLACHLIQVGQSQFTQCFTDLDQIICPFLIGNASVHIIDTSTPQPTPYPTSASPTKMPTPAPTLHICDSYTHVQGCDTGPGGICYKRPELADGFACACASGYYCTSGCDQPHYGHKCEASTAAPSTSPTPTPTATPAPTRGRPKPILNTYGSDVTTIEAVPKASSSSSSFYEDAGSVCSDYHDGDISGLVTVSGTEYYPDLTQVGQYTIKFNCVNSAGLAALTETRNIVVQDTGCPVCELALAPAVIEASFPFSDPGAMCVDAIDGLLQTQVTGFVEVDKTGEYRLTYKAVDKSGNWNDGTAVTAATDSEARCAGGKHVVRTVTVKDTLRPVIGLRYQNKLVHVSAGEDVGLGGQENSAYSKFYAELQNVRRRLLGRMASGARRAHAGTDGRAPRQANEQKLVAGTDGGRDNLQQQLPYPPITVGSIAALTLTAATAMLVLATSTANERRAVGVQSAVAVP